MNHAEQMDSDTDTQTSSEDQDFQPVLRKGRRGKKIMYVAYLQLLV